MKHTEKLNSQIVKVNIFGNWRSVHLSQKIITTEYIYKLYFSPECPFQEICAGLWKSKHISL